MTTAVRQPKQYCIPLERREDGVFFPAEIADLQGRDLPLLSELSDFFVHYYEEIDGIVEISSLLFETKVYRPNLAGDHSYVVVDDDYVPISVKSSPKELATDELSAFEIIAQKVEYSEALAPQESILISDAFIEPEFEEIDPKGDHKQRVSWSSVANMPRVILIGAPGAGKSTSLRRLTIEYLDRRRAGEPAPFPVYVQMRHFHGHTRVEQIVRQNLLVDSGATDGVSEGLNLIDAKVILILDGLDEIPGGIRQESMNSIIDFASRFQAVSIVASTREAGYDWQLPYFRYVRILPFNDEKIREWSYYRLGPSSSGGWLRFMTSLDERDELRRMAGNPLLLSVAVSLYRRNSVLPQDRATLFKNYFDAITDQWDSMRGVVRQREQWAAPAYKIAALCRTAYNVRSSSREFFTEREFFDWNADFDIDHSLLNVCERDTGVIVQDQPGKWTFTHRAYSDYLAARYIIDHTGDVNDSLASLIRSGDWIDVWAYSCGITQDATSLLYIVLRHRRIRKQQKIVAIATAFEQEIMASSNAIRDTAKFLESEIRRLLFKTQIRTTRVQTHNTHQTTAATR